MRFIGLHKDLELREIQIDFLTETISKCKNQNEIRIFMENVISASELAYISQRLHIIKLVLNGKTFPEIREEIGTTNGTINATKILMKSMRKKVLLHIAKYKLKEKAKKKNQSIKSEKSNFVNAHIPGAIKFDWV